MLAADILEVPISHKNHRYFTKWVEAVPLQNQTAATVTQAIIKICSTFCIPSILHSDQGHNFESHASADVTSLWDTEILHYSIPPTV